MTWADSVPNLLIGLREGLEAGLVVSILLAAVRKTAATRGATAPVWLGVLGAVTLSASFAAVLTFSTSVLSSRAHLQDTGLLSGQRWIAFDLTPHIDPGSWWVPIVTGVTDLEPKMTVLQVVAWVAYLAVVIPAFLGAGRTVAAAAPPGVDGIGLAVDGLPDGLVNGVGDTGFTGLHRLEYGLWHGQSAATLLPFAQVLARNVAGVQQNLGSADLAGDPTNLPVRAHEILEDALRDHLSGIDDQGGGAAFAMSYADVQITRAVLGYLTPLLNARQPGLAATAQSQLDTLRQALLATRADGQWESLSAASGPARHNVDAAIGAVLETLASVPDLLEVPPAH